MIQEMQELVERYWKWLHNNTTLCEVSGYVEITIPYLDRHNDYMQIYAKHKKRAV